MNEIKQDDRSAERICEIIVEIEQIWNDPYILLGNLEKNSFQNYCKRWKEEPRIGGLFRDSHFDFFPMLYSKHTYDSLDELWRLDRNAYVRLLSECKYSYLLRDYLTMRTGLDDRWDVLLEILSNAPICDEGASQPTPDVMLDIIKNVLAPTALSVIGWHLVDFGEEDKLNKDIVNEVVYVLSERDDGFFLAYHYARYLLWKSNHSRKEMIQKYSDFLSIFTEPFKVRAEEQFYSDEGIRFIPNNVLINDSIASPKDAFNDYIATGKISNVAEKKNNGAIDIDLLLNYRTVKWFLNDDKYAKTLFVSFKQMIAYDSLSFVNNDFNVRLEYYEIAELLLAQDDPLKAWDEVQDCMSAMRQRLMTHYHGDKSIEMNYRIRYMWNVNLVLLPYLYEAETDGKVDIGIAKKFWDMIWKDGIDYIRRYSRFRGTEVEEYLCRLICFYLVCFIRNGENSQVEEEQGTNVRILGPKRGRPYRTGTDEQIEKDELIDQWIVSLMSIFVQIDEMPIVVLRSVTQLLANGLRWEVVLGGSNGEFFGKEFQRANEISKGQKIYDWVGRFLKQKGYVYFERVL